MVIVDNGLKTGSYEIRGYFDYPRGGYTVHARLDLEIGCAIGCKSCNTAECLELNNGFYLNNYHQPEPCATGCLTCSGGREDDCLTCISDHVLKSGACIDPTEVPMVRTEKTVYQPGELIRIQYAGLGVSKDDWIAISKEGERDSQFITWKRTEARRGWITFLEGIKTPGKYEVKAHHNWPKGGF